MRQEGRATVEVQRGLPAVAKEAVVAVVHGEGGTVVEGGSFKVPSEGKRLRGRAGMVQVELVVVVVRLDVVDDGLEGLFAQRALWFHLWVNCCLITWSFYIMLHHTDAYTFVNFLAVQIIPM